jgi:hypothetical protein
MYRTTLRASLAALALAVPANAAAAGPTATLQRGTVTVTGTAARDVIAVNLDASQLTVDFGGDGTIDAQFPMSLVQQLKVLGGAGDDGISVEGTGVGNVPITINGGRGNDGGGVVSFADPTIAGSAPVTILGGPGNDDFIAEAPGPVTVDAGTGDDLVEGGSSSHETISLGDGNDRYVSDLNLLAPRGRNDVVDGGTGLNTMQLNGSFESESLDLSANAGHLIVNHDGQDRIDAQSIQDVSWFGFGGSDEGGFGDSVTVNDLSGTGVVNFTPDFSAPSDPAAPNNSADQLRVVGTPGDDHIAVSGAGAHITVAGLTPTITPVELDSKDVLRIDTLAGNDTVDSSQLERGLVQLQVF